MGNRRFDARTYYTDAATSVETVTIATVVELPTGIETTYQNEVGRKATCSVLTAELLAIAPALDAIAKEDCYPLVRVITDSQRALRAIAEGQCAPAHRAALATVIRRLKKAIPTQHQIVLAWVPAHKGVPGNEAADKAAKDVGASHLKIPRQPYYACEEIGRIKLLDERRHARKPRHDKRPESGKYTWKLDQALPGKHTRKLYDGLTSYGASILIQARTEHCYLRSCLFGLKLSDTSECECGAGRETTRHVILQCQRWTEGVSALSLKPLLSKKPVLLRTPGLPSL